MAVDLTSSLTWKRADAANLAMLDALQPNIVRGHVRPHLKALLLHFEPAAGRALLRALVQPEEPLLTSELTHLRAKEADASRVYVGIGLSHAGYLALGVSAGIPDDEAFQRGMKNVGNLGDPSVEEWEAPYQEDIHAVVLLSSASEQELAATVGAVRALYPAGVREIHDEDGDVWHNRNGQVAEHFGFRDGISRECFLTEDLPPLADGDWRPELALGAVLVPDRAADPARDFGSYLVFRKLEQNVRAFRRAELQIAGALDLPDGGVRAGELMIGRFTDGTSLLDGKPGTQPSEQNRFTYAGDPRGRSCPFPSHVRKANPRGSSDIESEHLRRHRMARRGITYGVRGPEPDAGAPPDSYPEGGVGLLFMAVNSSIEQQFEVVQRRWANDAREPRSDRGRPTMGLDPIVGQGSAAGSLTLPPNLGRPADRAVPRLDPPVVTMKGGEYFFLPSRTFLRTLA